MSDVNGAAAPPVKETKAQRAERLKKELNPWTALDQIHQFARDGWDSIPPQWMMYFRWWGIYSQGDGAGVTGGKGGEGKAVPYLMVRVRMANGMLFSHQLRAVADLCEKYGRGVGDITTRQNIQLHWIPVEALPDLFETLWRCGLTTLGACGDVTRNITGCPVAGLDATEVEDASYLVRQTTQQMVGDPEFYDLPRKYKICITGCTDWCSYPEINDIGMTAIRRQSDGQVGYSLRVGGGLSTDPLMAPRLDAFVETHQVAGVVRGITEIFRDADVLRENRERARLKFLFLKAGWTAGSFLEELHRRIGYQLAPAEPESPPNGVYRDHVGVHAQKQPGYYYIGASVQRGRINPEQMRVAADLADRYASGEVRLTVMQNLVIANVPERNVAEVVAGLTAAGMPVEASAFHRGVISCTGSEFCKLAITETKGFALWLTGEMEERLPGFDQDLKIHVTGCPNSCGQHWIADVGLEGKKIKGANGMEDAFYFFLGGGLGLNSGVARKTGYRCPATEVPNSLERLLRRYLQDRTAGESLRSFFGRHEEEQLKSLLTGEPVTA